jgi:hypothetical protein
VVDLELEGVMLVVPVEVLVEVWVEVLEGVLVALPVPVAVMASQVCSPYSSHKSCAAQE